MHPLLSQPSSQTISASKPSIAKDVDQSERLASARNERHRDDTTANFSHFFERDEAAKPFDQTLDVVPAETAVKNDQTPDTTGAAMTEVELSERRKVDILDGDTPDHMPNEADDAGLDSETSRAAQGPNGTNATEIEKPDAVERPVVPHHFGWTGGSETTTEFTKAIEPVQRAAATVIERPTAYQASALAGSTNSNQNSATPDLTKAAAQPVQGQTASGTAPNSITGAQAVQQSALPVQMMQPAETAPRTEPRTRQAPASGTPATPSLNRTQTAQTTLRNNPLVAGVMQQASDQAQTLKALSNEPLTLFTPDTTATPNPPPGTAPTRADLPVHIARQLIEVAQHLPSRPVDITLSPDELGRVRLSVIPSETGIVVNVLAERPETLDLMRRHIDQLAQEFQSLGYDDISFSFSGSESGTSGEKDEQSGENKTHQTSRDLTNDIMENTRIHLSTGATTGLDLRL